MNGNLKISTFQAFGEMNNDVSDLQQKIICETNLINLTKRFIFNPFFRLPFDSRVLCCFWERTENNWELLKFKRKLEQLIIFCYSNFYVFTDFQFTSFSLWEFFNPPPENFPNNFHENSIKARSFSKMEVTTWSECHCEI